MAGWSPAVFARELPPRSAGFNAENRLYSFALTMPVKLMLEKNDPRFTRSKWRQGYFYSDPSIVDGEVADLAKPGLPEQ
jgi:hypothetical protein